MTGRWIARKVYPIAAGVTVGAWIYLWITGNKKR